MKQFVPVIPTHPGHVIRQHVLQALGLSAAELARSLRFNKVALHYVLHGRTGISPALAVRLACFSNISAEDWLNLQQRYDMALAQLKSAEKLAKIVPYGGRPLRLKNTMAKSMDGL